MSESKEENYTGCVYLNKELKRGASVFRVGCSGISDLINTELWRSQLKKLENGIQAYKNVCVMHEQLCICELKKKKKKSDDLVHGTFKKIINPMPSKQEMAISPSY